VKAAHNKCSVLLRVSNDCDILPHDMSCVCSTSKTATTTMNKTRTTSTLRREVPGATPTSPTHHFIPNAVRIIMRMPMAAAVVTGAPAGLILQLLAGCWSKITRNSSSFRASCQRTSSCRR
jgi:hypothetical protein